MNLKGERVASDIVREISGIILTEVHDEDIKKVTITHANVTNDLSFAKIYFTTLDEANKEKITKDINKAKGYFRSLLADRLNIRHIPELKFVYDESIEYGKNIENIISELNER